jgi:hypothetical protein
MKNLQLHEHQGGFSDCRIWPLYIAYSMIGFLLISTLGSGGAVLLLIPTYGIVFIIGVRYARRYPSYPAHPSDPDKLTEAEIRAYIAESNRISAIHKKHQAEDSAKVEAKKNRIKRRYSLPIIYLKRKTA